MAPLLYCLVMLYQIGIVSTDAECTVTGCNSTSCDGNKCTQCIDPYYRHGDSCRQCYLHCRLCDGNLCYKCFSAGCNYACEIADCPSSCRLNVKCPNCPDGFYSAGGHCYRCLHTGCKCSSGSNCVDCLPGRYDISSNCENKCPRECISCTSKNDCSKCVAGMYGPACALDCMSLCEDYSCDKDSGICSTLCPADQYLDSYQKCRKCPYRCSKCTSFSECIFCKKTHYWGPACDRDCVGCVNNCSKDIGCLSECANRYYREYSEDLNGYICSHCPETCRNCNNASQCTACETGYWGNKCQHNCSGCIASCNINDGCSSGCLSGYYGNVINGGIHCEICPDNCVLCSYKDTCKECRSGFYSPDETNCIACSDKCFGGNCITHNGICRNGCLKGWTGHQCNQKCPPECLLCEQFNSSHCSSCKIGFYGDSCKNICSVHCKQNDEHNTCHKVDGSCLKGCKSGYWGQNCSRPCGLGCYGNQCNETTGICYSGCKDNFSGNQCNKKCNGFVKVGQYKGVDADDNTTHTTTVVALSVVAGIAVVVAAISITVNVILLKKGRVFRKESSSRSATEVQEMDSNTYQDLNRTDSADTAYSSVIPDYSNIS